MTTEKTCKTCKYFEPFLGYSDIVCNFRCNYKNKNVPLNGFAPCKYHEFAAPTWEPLDPDEYEIGCTERGFCECNDNDSPFHCVLGEWYRNYKIDVGHKRMCERLPCYRPKKKKRVQRYRIWKVPEEHINAFMVVPSSNGRAVYGRSIFHDSVEDLKRHGITCEIIEEPIE